MERVRVGLVGCGSVSARYLEDLKTSPHVELTSVCDVLLERARKRSEEFGVPHAFSELSEMLAGPEFDFLINTTGMQAHYSVNREALAAGKHVLCEKPIAGTLQEAQQLIALAKEKGVRLWGAPNAVTSPQFRCMAETLAGGELGEVYAAHACYGHGGPSWGPWFYQKGGGSLFDLGVYNVTTLTGLLGPAKGVVALAGTAIKERHIEGERVQVEADDNTMLLLDHGNAVYSHIQTGFVYGLHNDDRTIELIGTNGAMNLLGWDWGPLGVQVRTLGAENWETRCPDPQGYTWQHGGSYLAECLVTGRESLMTAEHAAHTLEVMKAALESAASGRRVALRSSFSWPLIS